MEGFCELQKLLNHLFDKPVVGELPLWLKILQLSEKNQFVVEISGVQ